MPDPEHMCLTSGRVMLQHAHLMSGIHGYGPDEGLPALREALKHKLATRNGLPGVSSIIGWPAHADQHSIVQCQVIGQ